MEENVPEPRATKSRFKRLVLAAWAAILVAVGGAIYAAAQSSPEMVAVEQARTTATTTSTTRLIPLPPVNSAPTVAPRSTVPALSDEVISDLRSRFAPKTPPNLTVSCPDTARSSGATVAAAFGHQIKAGNSPVAHWEVDYGDGKHYQTDEKPGAAKAVFNHTYTESGSFIFAVTVTDQNGLTDYDSCVFSWFKPYAGSIPSIADLDYDLPDYDDPYPPGGFNDSGCPRDQWVNGYYRKDGTYVNGYYRNSPTDGCGGG
ncbi:MAG: PKD domain-containing protein [Actinomycetota bacterium]